ncbi:MAG: DnaD domain protein [Erysipelotrichaceae bacterium]|nr:DnaD domain protein [Erysipelotrichaceae bacterium]
MKKWYKESYFDRKNWILENFDKLNLKAEEAMLLLLVELCRQNRKAVTYDYLTEKLHKNTREIDRLIAGLVNRHYLKLTTNSRGLVFDIEGIFEFDPEKYELSVNRDIYELVSDIFGKPLSPSEMQKMNDLIEEYDQERFLQALRIAEANRKLKMAYIEGILRNEK